MNRILLNLIVATRLMVPAAIPALFLIGVPTAASAADSVSAQAVRKAHAYLAQEDKGREVLGVVHTFATYRRHDYVTGYELGGGTFSLVYRYFWNEEDHTDIEFRCTSGGYVNSLRVLSTTAWVQQPFLMSRTLVKVMGNAFLRSEGDQLTAADRARIQRLIDNADTKALLETMLFVEQVL
jgi:hypothetical protein